MYSQATSHTEIEQEDFASLERALSEKLQAPKYRVQIKILVLAGKVYLDGVAGSYREKLLAEKACTDLVPGLSTINRLRVVPDVPDQWPQTPQTHLHTS